MPGSAAFGGIHVCMDNDCGHAYNTQTCSAACKLKCCRCGGKMFRSGAHTPASNCSSTSMASLGPAPSLRGMDTDFEKQLSDRLTAFQATSDTAEASNDRIAQWKEMMAELLADDAEAATPQDHTELWQDSSAPLKHDINGHGHEKAYLNNDVVLDECNESPARGSTQEGVFIQQGPTSSNLPAEPK